MWSVRLHGTFPPLAREDAMINMIDIAEDLLTAVIWHRRLSTPGFWEPMTSSITCPGCRPPTSWLQIPKHWPTLPDGADVNAITWEQFGQWCQNILDETGEQRCGLPHAGLFHRFLEGYLFPSFTGGMVTEFRSDAAVDMMTWARDSLWPTINPQSINYDFMQEPLLSGEVWVAFDHTARLIDAFNTEPDNFIAFPAPAGPQGRGFMPVIVGLGIPADAPDPEGAAELIEFLTRPDVQGAVLNRSWLLPGG